MKTFIPPFGSALLALAFGLLISAPTRLSAAGPITINGSGSGLEMMKPLVKAYQKTHPGIEISMGLPLGSSGALKALAAGALDLVVSSKPPTAEDEAKGIQFQEYGATPLVLVTAPKVARTDVTTDQLADLYSGQTRTWADGSPVRVVLRPEGDIDTRLLKELSPRMATAIAAAQMKPGMILAVTDPESNLLVAKTPGALGATGLTGLLGDYPPLNVLTLNGIQGTPQTLANGTYPLAKAIRFATTARTSPEARGLLEFIYSPKGQAIARKAGVRVL